MIKRKAGVHVRIGAMFRKRALFGVAIFCITAIATIGALSTGGNEEDNTPKSLVDLNATETPGADQQVAEQEDNTNQETVPVEQVAEQNKDGGEVAEATDSSQVAEQEPSQTGSEEPQEVTEVAQKPEENPKVQEQTSTQVAEDSEQPKEQPEQAEVLSPQLIAEQLNFDKASGLLWPIAGEVVIPYSPDHGVYYPTLEQFSASEAVVLSSTVGTEVKAAAKGVVTSIEENVRTGTTVTLALGNNTSLVYGQLDIADLEEGDVVAAGECIGTVAEPTRYYVVEGPNLYFQVLEGEESIDPMGLLQGE